MLEIATVGMVVALSTSLWAQESGTIRGIVELVENEEPVHGAVVLVVGTEFVELTDGDGTFEMQNVPAGTYEILAQREHLTAVRQTVTLEAGDTVRVTFRLALSPVHEELTVTATIGGQATTFEAFNAVTTLDSFDLVANPVGTLGEALEDQPGIARRSFGPGSSRPIIRGFDGDRVLMMEDGVRTGDLSGQSGDHAATVDPNSLERIEVVRGPVTLLYGSNAVGGVVNAITSQATMRATGLSGTQGQLSLDGGSANSQVGTSANLQHAANSLRVWAGGSTRRTGDYGTPDSTIENSATRLTTGRMGVGYSGSQLFASGGLTFENGRYGVPFAGEIQGGDSRGLGESLLVDLESRRNVGRLDIGLRNLGTRGVESFQVVLAAIDWEHDEIEIADGAEDVGTSFDNRTYILRADIDQRQLGVLSGRFGFWSQFRDYAAVGEETLAPATNQNAFAVFAYEELDLGRSRIQFGGRVERNAYTVAPRVRHLDETDTTGLQPAGARDRTFTGISASVGAQTDLGPRNTLVASLSRSHRAPALEELYNLGPHVGNVAFEIGNFDLHSESTVGLDLSIRHQSQQIRGSVNAYVYAIDNFVFQDVGSRFIDGLRVARFAQADSRFAGFEAQGSVRLAGQIWANIGLGFVDAQLTATSEALPRIPPLQGQVSVDIHSGGLTITPEVNLVARQDAVFREETPTSGYAVLNLRLSYVWARQHMAHILTVRGYNLTNDLYRNHASFIKDLAPEIGRGVKVGYSLRFF